MKFPDIQNIIEEVKGYFQEERFKGVKRLYSARQVAEQQGTIYNDYSIAKEAAVAFYKRLRELYGNKEQITTFGPYSPSQAVMMKRAGIEGIYLGGWATSAKGSIDEDPGADLASYPLSQVPNEAAGIVRALLTADRNQYFMRNNTPEEERESKPVFDFRPFIIADADTGHGGDAQVRNLIRRFVEAGVPGYHIEDQKPGTKKCGHQGGKVLVSVDEQIKRLNAARFQLDIMRVPGIIVARTDAEAATLLENMSDERDHPFVLGATNPDVPSYKSVFIALHTVLNKMGVEEIFGHDLYQLSKSELNQAADWLAEHNILNVVQENVDQLLDEKPYAFEPAYDSILVELVKVWENEARVKTIGDTVADLIELHNSEGTTYEMTKEEWLSFAKSASIKEASEKATELGIEYYWDYELTKTPEGYFQVKGGIPYAIAKSLAVAPYADILWMETKTADLEDAKVFADAIHAEFPDMMLAYNLSPSFNWDSTGMTEQEMSQFPSELGKMGFVFNFITYGGHQIDGLASDEFAQALQHDGMLALATIQRKFRLLESPYKKPQTHVGGPRLDGALAASSARTATTKAMGKGSTEVQHLIQTELPVALLNQWLEKWAENKQINKKVEATLRPHKPGSNIIELSLYDGTEKLANVVFTIVIDRNKDRILSVRDQNTLDTELRRKRLMTLLQIFLMNRYKANVIHYLTPTEDNYSQTTAMKGMNLFTKVNDEIGQIIVADVNIPEVKSFVEDSEKISKIIDTSDLTAV